MFSYKRFLLKNTLIICIIFSMLFIASFYIFEYNSSKTSYVEEAANYISSVKENFDEAVRKTQDLSIIFQSNDDFREYVESGESTPYMRRLVAKYFHSTINSMSNASGQTVFVTLERDKDLISGETVMSWEYFCQKYNIPLETLRDTVSETSKKSIPKPVMIFSTVGNSDYFTVFVKDPNSFALPYIIVSVYDLEKLTGKPPLDSILIINDGSSSVFLSDPSKEKELEGAFEGKIPYKYTMLYEDKDYSSAYGFLHYMLVMKKAGYIYTINSYIPYTIPFAVLFFLLSYVFANFAANRSHKPIKAILDQISAISPSEQENEIERISSAISLLVSRNKNLSEAAGANSSALKEKFINDLIQNKLTAAQVSYGIRMYLNELDVMPLLMIIVSIDYYNSERTEDNASDMYSYYGLLKSLSEKTFKDNDFMLFTSVVPSVYCIIVSSKNEHDIRQKLTRMFSTAERDMGMSLIATIGGEISDWRELPSVFNSAYLTHTTVTSGSDRAAIVDNNDIDIKFFYSSDIDEMIYNYCIHSDKESLKKTVTTLLEKNFPDNDMFKKNIDALSLLIYALHTRIIATLNIPAEEIYLEGYNIYLELKTSKNREEFKNKVMFAFNGIINYNLSSKTNYEQTYCDKMLDFVHKNYKENISLTDVAEHMNMSQGYVSRLFKKLVHSNFKEYLAKIRLENAKQLLIEKPNATIQEISAMVGFNTTRTFTNAFSSAFGMTPTEYRHKKI